MAPTSSEVFSPAENLLLRDGRRFDWMRALEATLFDLVNQRVLEVIEVEPAERSGSSREIYVVRGPELRRHRPLDHELPFVAPFSHDAQRRERVEDVLKRAAESIGSKRELLRLLLRSPRLRACYRTAALDRFAFVGWKTKSGRAEEHSLKAELDEAAEAFSELAGFTLDATHHLVRRLGGKVYLLDGTHELLFHGRSPLDLLLPRIDAGAERTAEAESPAAEASAPEAEVAEASSLDASGADAFPGVANQLAEASGAAEDAGATDAGGDSGD